MADENPVVEPQVDPNVTPEVVTEPVVDPALKDLEDKLNREIEARKQLTARAKTAEADKKALEAKLKMAEGATAPLDVEDYIDISASLEGLDQREKAKLASEHKLTGKPLGEIRNSEDFSLWQDAYRQKVAKEKALKPNGTQPEADRPKTLQQRLAETKSFTEKEKILSEAGLWKSPRPKSDRQKIL